MPFIRVTTNRKLTLRQEIEIKTGLGKLISILPGKKEENLMVHIEDNQIMYFQGEDKRCMMTSVSLYKHSPLEAKQEFAKQMTAMLETVTGVERKDQYVSFSEFENWGKQGELV